MIETIKIKSHCIEHNDRPWQIKLDTTFKGRGWIDGPDRNIYWYNCGHEDLDEQDARQVVEEHNQWLKDQESPQIKLIKAMRNKRNYECSIRELYEQVEILKKDLEEQEEIIRKLGE